MNLKKISINAALPEKARSRILIIYTGGTFGMTYDKDGVLIPFDFASILEHLPTLKNLSLEITVVSFEMPIDSSNINPGHWQVIGEVIKDNYDQHDGFVVLHGTDTMAFTASALSFMLEGLHKPVIFTGAQLPISEPRSDARENLITSLDIASARRNGEPLVNEVCIYFDYVLLRGNRSKKVESMQFDAFNSGNYPPLAKAGVKIDYNFSAMAVVPSSSLTLRKSFETNISILKLFPGISQEIVHAILSIPGLKAVVMETYGSGNAPTLPWLTEELKRAIENGVIILNISQCPGGRVLQGRYETSKKLQQIGVIGGADMTTEAAVTKLMLLIGEYGPDRARELVGLSLAGELTA
ncbi:asparaginase [Parachryseolinea silvisoli]|jgi:L-asparaginase|uniref:asparaginase n=1 Tax=Parachryseolinea silvisoli TaxID=2873601 RepID=UPI0022659C37|nr:asparaginase [Parachryseolinea silvisoli]MCD9014237.1 asparaginase [Parachryseolinea silvisoli]